MSRTFSLVCHDCKEMYGAGQSERGNKYYLTYRENKTFPDYMIRHQGHNMEVVVDCESLRGNDK